MKVIYPKNFSSSRNKIIIDYCKGKKVLHIGACDAPFTKEKYNGNIGPLLYREIDKVCSQQLGIDLDKKSIEFLNSKKEEFLKSEVKFFDMNKLDNLNFNPDVIIFGEVIEHLMNLEIALTNIKKIMNKDTLLIISTPNAYYINNFVNSLFGFEYMHEDHKVYFSYGYLENLLKFNGIYIKKGFFTFGDGGKKEWWGRKVYKFLSKIIPGYSESLLVFCTKNVK